MECKAKSNTKQQQKRLRFIKCQIHFSFVIDLKTGICWSFFHEFVGNKAKRRISKRVFQENKARQIFQKTNISYPLIWTRMCVYQGVRNVRFSENLAYFLFLKHPSWDLPFCRIIDEFTATAFWFCADGNKFFI